MKPKPPTNYDSRQLTSRFPFELDSPKDVRRAARINSIHSRGQTRLPGCCTGRMAATPFCIIPSVALFLQTRGSKDGLRDPAVSPPFWRLVSCTKCVALHIAHIPGARLPETAVAFELRPGDIHFGLRVTNAFAEFVSFASKRSAAGAHLELPNRSPNFQCFHRITPASAQFALATSFLCPEFVWSTTANMLL